TGAAARRRRGRRGRAARPTARSGPPRAGTSEWCRSRATPGKQTSPPVRRVGSTCVTTHSSVEYLLKPGLCLGSRASRLRRHRTAVSRAEAGFYGPGLVHVVVAAPVSLVRNTIERNRAPVSESHPKPVRIPMGELFPFRCRLLFDVPFP